MDYKLDVIVLTHNNLKLTMGCMDALYQHTVIPFHLIVIDDSTDGMTPLYFEKLKEVYDNITFIHSDVPYKCGNQIFNIGLELCKTPYIATIMNSTEVEPSWFRISLRILGNDPTVGTVGMKSLFEHNGRIECAGIYIEDYLPCDIGRDEAGHRLSDVYQVEATQWAFALHRVSALNGNLDEDIFHGFVGVDDIDNCFAIRNKGWKVIYNGNGVAYHRPRATRGADISDTEAFKKNGENLEAFYRRWGYWENFKKANPDVPGTREDVKFVADGKAMKEREYAAGRNSPEATEQ